MLEVLANATNREDDRDDIVLRINLRLSGGEVSDLQIAQLGPKEEGKPTPKDLMSLAGSIYDARRARDRMMGETFFGEPAWDMLLALYAQPARGLPMAVTTLNQCAGVPPSTALRWQKLLLRHGLIDRSPKLFDGRSQIVRLSDHGRALMDAYLTRRFSAERRSSGAAAPDRRARK